MTRNMTDEELRQLEDIMDAIGIGNLLANLASLCHDKADHVSSTWQDEELAKLWERNAEAIDACNVEDA